MRNSLKLLTLAMIVGSVVGVVALTNTITQAQNAGLASGPTKVAVCDIVSVFGNYKRAKALTRELTQRSKQYEAEAKRKAEALEQLQVELSGLRPGSEQYKAAAQKLQQGIIRREVWARITQDSIRRDHVRLTEEVFNEIKAMIAKVSREQGINLVLQLEGGEINAKTSPQLIAQINSRKVLYNSSKINLTKTVLNRLNSAYRSNN